MMLIDRLNNRMIDKNINTQIVAEIKHRIKLQKKSSATYKESQKKTLMQSKKQNDSVIKQNSSKLLFDKIKQHRNKLNYQNNNTIIRSSSITDRFCTSDTSIDYVLSSAIEKYKRIDLEKENLIKINKIKSRVKITTQIQKTNINSDKKNNIVKPPSTTSKKFKLTIALAASMTGALAVANIPTSIIVSNERIIENLNVQLNVLTEKNLNQTYMQVAYLGKQDTLSSLLKKLDIDDISAENFIRNNSLAKFLLQTRESNKVIAQINENKELISLKSIVHSTDVNSTWVEISKDKSGSFSANKFIAPNTRETEVISDTVSNNNFVYSLQNKNIDNKIIQQVLNIFSGTINFYYDTKTGDKFRVVYEKITNQNEFVSYGKVLAVEIINSKGAHQAIWYPENQEYYNFSGESLKRSVIKAPLENLEITSNFGYRHHPISGYSHKHTGVDFAAPKGTNVFASSGGIVEFVGVQRGYGNIVILNHGKGINTYYAHLSGFGNIALGQKIDQGEVIGFVGSTGSSTGNHLHYEYRIAGQPTNPLDVIGDEINPLNIQEKGKFFAYTKNIMQQIQAMREFNINNKT